MVSTGLAAAAGAAMGEARGRWFQREAQNERTGAKSGPTLRLHSSDEKGNQLVIDDAKKELVTSLKDEAKSDAMAFIQDAIEEAKLTAQQEARKVILNTIQRVGVEQTVENCVSVFNIESDDVLCFIKKTPS